METGGAQGRTGEIRLRVRFVIPPNSSAAERAVYPLCELESPGSRAVTLDLPPQSRTLLAILSLIPAGERAKDLEGRLGSKGAYSGARRTLIARLEERGAADLLILPEQADNGRGPLRLRHDRCEVDLIQLGEAAKAGDSSSIKSLTLDGTGAVDFERWASILAHPEAIDLDADSYEEIAGRARAAGRVAPAAVSGYLERLDEYCSALPSWFPDSLRFDKIVQDVAVRPPGSDTRAEEGGDAEISAAAEADRQVKSREARRQSPSRRIPWTTALRQLRRVFLIGDPGAGKTWAIRATAMSFAEDWYSKPAEALFPILVLAPRLEEQLRGLPAGAGRKELIAAVAAAMPESIAAEEGAIALVKDMLERREPVALLVDGYDEIRTERPRLAQRLSDVVALLDADRSYFALASRPSSAPQGRLTQVAATCDLQSFAEREQLRFVDRWFAEDEERARQARRWVKDRRLELLRTPLLIALFCAVFGDSKDSPPPESEPDLWKRAVARLASEEDRYEEVREDSELVRIRTSLLEDLARTFVTADGLRESVAVTTVEEALVDLPMWGQLENLKVAATVIDDLAATGVVQKVTGASEQELVFLHSALRDYLLARHLARTESWSAYLPLLWAQPEWEPVIGYVGALIPSPDELLLSLEAYFRDDPLNAARFTAGRILAVTGDEISALRRREIRNQLLILLGSRDTIDRNRSADLLASLQDAETAEMVRSLVNPALPTSVVIAALRTIAGGTSTESIETLCATARSETFTAAEQGAAVEALAEMGSDPALEALGELAADLDVKPSTRAGAAFYALRLFGDEGPSRSLLATTGDESRAARWKLTEILAAQAEVVGDLIADVESGDLEVSDPYCLALFRSIESLDRPDAWEELVKVLPDLPVVDLVSSAVESARKRIPKDPLMLPLARYLLDTRPSAELRLRLARAILANEDLGAAAVTSTLLPREALDVAAFLVALTPSLPEELSKRLEEALRAGEFGPSGQLFVQELEEEVGEEASSTDPGPAPAEKPPEDKDESREPEEPGLDQIFHSPLDQRIQYQLLREQRRTLPAGGELREIATSLTHSVSVGQATHWIDAQPAVAPLVEDRLIQARSHDRAVELACLRARWPERYEEVADTAGAFNSRLLDARAEAALLSDNFDEAATMALASIGARQAEKLAPTSLSVILLFAAGAATGRTYSTLRQVSAYIPEVPQTYSDLVLSAWRDAAKMQFDAVTGVLALMPPHVIATDANVAGLRMAAELAGPEAFEGVISWSQCKRVAVLLSVLHYFTESESVKQRIAAAAAAAERHAIGLSEAWPPSALDPGDQAKPKWADMLVKIASEELLDGRAQCAVDIYSAVVEESPTNPNFVNNLGFCQVPVDREAALETLDRAAELYGHPFGVNVANRMLLEWLRGNHQRAHELGDEYYLSRPAERGGMILWDMDDPTTLLRNVKLLDYIVRLGEKATLAMERDDLHEVWEKRRRLLEAEAEAELAEIDEASEAAV